MRATTSHLLLKRKSLLKKQPEAVTEEKAEPEHLTNICDLKAELEAKREEGFSESADSDEADDGEAPTVNFSDNLILKAKDLPISARFSAF